MLPQYNCTQIRNGLSHSHVDQLLKNNIANPFISICINVWQNVTRDDLFALKPIWCMDHLCTWPHYTYVYTNKRENIQVGCWPPDCQPYMLLNEHVWTYGWEVPVQWGLSWKDGGEGSLHGEVQCIVGNGHMGPSPRLQAEWQTHTTLHTQNITFPQLRWRVVTNKTNILLRLIYITAKATSLSTCYIVSNIY